MHVLPNGRWMETPLCKVILCNYEPFILMNKAGRAAQFRWHCVSRRFTAARLLSPVSACWIDWKLGTGKSAGLPRSSNHTGYISLNPITSNRKRGSEIDNPCSFPLRDVFPLSVVLPILGLDLLLHLAVSYCVLSQEPWITRFPPITAPWKLSTWYLYLSLEIAAGTSWPCHWEMFNKGATGPNGQVLIPGKAAITA